MDLFMPSEVARLVLGYLKEMECVRTIRIYLTENSDLNEYVNCLQQGQEYPTSIGGKTLTDILNDYCFMKASAEKSSAEICKLINRIDGSLAHVKYFVANGRTDSRLEESSIINHLPCEEASRLTLLSSEKTQDFSDEENNQTTSLQFSKNIQTVSVCTQTNLSIPFTVDQYTQTQKCAMVNKGTQLSEDLVVNDTHTLTAALTLDGLPGHSWISNISEGSVSYSSSTCHPTPICSVLNLQSDSSVLKLPVSNLGLQSRCSPSKEQDLPNDVTCKSARRKSSSPQKRLSSPPNSSPVKLDVCENYNDVSDNCNTSENISETALIGDRHNMLHERITTNINTLMSNTTCILTSGNDSLNATRQSLPASEASVTYELNSNVTAYTNVKEAVIKTVIHGTEDNHVTEGLLSNDNIIQDHQTGLCTNNEPSQILNEEPSNHTISTGTSATFHAIPSSSYQIIQISGSHYFPPKNNVKFSPGSVEYEYVQSTLDLLKKKSVTCLHKKKNTRFAAGYPRYNVRSKRKKDASDNNTSN